MDEHLALSLPPRARARRVIVAALQHRRPAAERPVRDGDPALRRAGAGRRAARDRTATAPRRARSATSRTRSARSTALMDAPRALGRDLQRRLVGARLDPQARRAGQAARPAAQLRARLHPLRRGLRPGHRGHAPPRAGDREDQGRDRLAARRATSTRSSPTWSSTLAAGSPSASRSVGPRGLPSAGGSGWAAAERLEGRVAVLSPHLDDGIFSLGAAIAAARAEVEHRDRPGRRSRVGAPGRGVGRTGGLPHRRGGGAGPAGRGRACLPRRRREARVAAVLRPPVRARRDDDEIWARLEAAIGDADTVLVPGFPLMHEDHVWLAGLVGERGLRGRRVGPLRGAALRGGLDLRPEWLDGARRGCEGTLRQAARGAALRLPAAADRRGARPSAALRATRRPAGASACAGTRKSSRLARTPAAGSSGRACAGRVGGAPVRRGRAGTPCTSARCRRRPPPARARGRPCASSSSSPAGVKRHMSGPWSSFETTGTVSSSVAPGRSD